MNDIFNSDLKLVLETAHKLKLANEADLAKDMCMKAIREYAKHKDTDVLTFFYGKQVYNGVTSASDAARYIFIAQCAKDAYDAIEPLGSAIDSKKPWAKVSKEVSNEDAVKAFSWLRKPSRAVTDEDSEYFKLLIKVAKNSDKVNFMLSDRTKKLKLLDLVKNLVFGAHSISERGELK